MSAPLRASKIKVCPIVGKFKVLRQNSLPSVKDVLCNYLLKKDELITKKVCTRNVHSMALSKVLDSLLMIWSHRNIQTMSRKRIKFLFDKFNQQRLGLLKSQKRDKNNPVFKAKLNSFTRKSNVMFNIGITTCLSNKKNYCEQSLNNNQEVDQVDLIDGSTVENDVNVSSEKSARKCKKLPDKPFPLRNRNRLELPTVFSLLDRLKLSSMVGAAISSATLVDVGLITENDMSNVIDTCKIRRAREKHRKNLANGPFENFEGLYFDGKKDKTLVLSEDRSKRMVITEEHVSLLKEPGSEYIGHISPTNSKAPTVVESLSEFFFSKGQVDFMTNLKVVGCDGTNTNTGGKAGIIALIEKEIRAPLQWFICQLHANELPLRHLLYHLDGGTVGPKELSGIIGKALETCEDLPLVNFKRVHVNIPDIIKLKEDLSTDQAYLRDICRFISGDERFRAVANRSPGKICNSRWLTTANRILRLYIGTKKPTKNLKTLVEFITKVNCELYLNELINRRILNMFQVYAPMWFHIKIHHSCLDGPSNLFKTIALSRYLPKNLKSIIDPVIQRNGYFGHPENVLLAMLADERKEIRNLAYNRISQCRSSIPNFRRFNIPSFNFDASDYFEILNWEGDNITEPPLLRDLSMDELKQMVDSTPNATIEYIKKFPCHTQAVERTVKLVSESSMLVTDPVKRDGVIKATLESRRKMPLFKSKQDFAF